jgi:tRNA-modifying protein YgfZ
MLFNRSARLRMQFTGAKAAESLTGLVTNDVLALRGGDGVYACALTAKGRIIADVRILAFAGAEPSVQSLLVDTNEAAGAGFATMIRKYVNPRLAKYTDVTATTACLTLVGDVATGALAAAGVDAALCTAIATGAPFTHREASVGGASVVLARVPDLGATLALDVHCTADDLSAVRTAVLQAGAREADRSEWHRLRVVAGRPEWGIDMDEGTLAQEANMDALNAISYQKGCYTGQETVARVHFRGHVNKTLRRVQFADAVAPPLGTFLLASDEAVAGDTRSTAISDANDLVGLAMVRREVGDRAELWWVDAGGARHQLRVVGAAD